MQAVTGVDGIDCHKHKTQCSLSVRDNSRQDSFLLITTGKNSQTCLSLSLSVSPPISTHLQSQAFYQNVKIIIFIFITESICKSEILFAMWTLLFELIIVIFNRNVRKHSDIILETWNAPKLKCNYKCKNIQLHVQ